MSDRSTRWIDQHVGADITSAGQLNLSLWGSVLQNDLRGGTLTRVVGNLQMVSATIAGAYGVQEMHIGFGVVSQEALSAGSASLPDPTMNSEFPVRGWVYKTSRLVMQNGTFMNGITSWTFDLHAQRKIDTGEFVIIAKNVSINGTTFTTKLHGTVRTLVLLA